MDFFKRIAQNFRQQGALTQIIIINAAVFLTVNIVANIAHSGNLLQWLALPLDGEHFLKRFWTLFTYMFTHAGLMHIFWNMFTLYLFAQVFFILFKEKKFVYVYVMSGLCGGALLLVLGLIFPEQLQNNILIGASAAVTGIGAIMLVYTPDYMVFPFGIPLRYKYYFLIIFTVTTLIDLADNTGGKISHIGGALFGALYGYSLRSGSNWFNFSFFKFKKKSHLYVASRNPQPSAGAGQSANYDEKRVNELLEKISKSGYESLSKSEKDELFRLSQKK